MERLKHPWVILSLKMMRKGEKRLFNKMIREVKKENMAEFFTVYKMYKLISNESK